jgi:hypothetical protein
MSRSVHVIRHPDGGWAIKQSAGGRHTSLHKTQAEAIVAGRRLAAEGGGGEVLIHRSDGRLRDRDTVPPRQPSGAWDTRAKRRAPRTEGPRTTMRVPESLARTAEALANELGVSRNDALVRLATRGAALYEQERQIAEHRDRRWSAVLARLRDVDQAELPSPEVARAAVIEARRT